MEEKDVGDIYADFLVRQSYYSGRNTLLDLRDKGFNGEHWPDGEVTDNTADENKEEASAKFKLVLNYTRRVVLGYVAALARQPKPRVPIPADDIEAARANRREKLLMVLFQELMPAWYDVELNAAKLGYGVLQVVWQPDADQPKEVNVGQGENEVKKKRYTKSPFKCRSIPPNLFYPVYRTYDHANDFMEVYRHDPGRLVKDVEKQYSVELQSTGTLNADGWHEVETEPTCDLVEYWSKTDYWLIAITQKKFKPETRRATDKRESQEARYTLLKHIANPYEGTFPFWVVQNIRSNPLEDPTLLGSVSDLDDILELNKHIDLILSENAEEVVTNIHRPVVYKSDDPTQDPAGLTFAAAAVYPIGLEEELDTLDYRNDPTHIENHIKHMYQALEDLTFLGSAGFGNMETGTSGIAARVALTPMQQMLELKLPQRQLVLQHVCSFLLENIEKRAEDDSAFTGWVENQYKRFQIVTISKADIDGAYYADVSYGNLLPRDEYAFQQNEVYKWKTGVQSLMTTLDNLGADDPNAELERIKRELQDPILNPDHVRMMKELEMMGASQPQPAMPMQPNAMPAGGPQGGVQSLPGSAQPGTMPLSQQPPPGNIGGPAPQVPGEGMPFQQGPGQEGSLPGQSVPYMNRGGNNAANIRRRG